MPRKPRYDTDSEYRHECNRLHDEAYAEGLEHYIDPDSGYKVFTKLFMERRGFCCESRCRHCPWDYGRDKVLKKE